MSFSAGGAQELLSRGLAAAQSAARSGDPRDHEEAEFYLEWALRDGLDVEGQIEAWLWLARIAGTQERKRDRLENVLAIRPSHPDARLEMAILEGRVKLEEVRADPWQSGQAVAVGGEGATAGEARRFPCPKCGAQVVYRPGMANIGCQFCGAKLDAKGNLAGDASPVGNQDVTEGDWIAAIHTEIGHSWHLPMSRVLECEGCGATVTFAPGRVSTQCQFCGSPYTVKSAPAGTELREPEGIVPFAFDGTHAGERVREWLRERSGQGGVPDDLARFATLHDLQPIYLPFWAFTVGGEVRWSGYVRDDLGMGANLGDMDNAMNAGGIALGVVTGNYEIAANSIANMAQARAEGRNLVYSSGAVPVHLDDIAVPATRSVPPRLLLGLKYDAGGAVPYREEMLASLPAEVYTVPISDASLQARESAIEATDKEIELFTGGITGGEATSLSKDRRGMTVVSYKLLLVPAWMAGYAYKGKEYRLIVNGQSGEVEGYLPKREGAINRLFGKRDAGSE